MSVILALILMALGILVTLRPKTYWWLWRGWIPDAAKHGPDDMELLRGRVAGICIAVSGVFILYWILTQK